jgi:serpin B
MKTLILTISFIFLIHFSFAQKEISIIESNNKFSFDIYQKLKKQDNLIFSPASITSAVAMTYIGAKNNTHKEIAETFYFNTNTKSFSKDYSKLFIYKSNSKNKLIFLNANSIWIQNELEVKNDFLNTNRQYFSSSLHFTDFIKETEKSRLKINKWVEDNTNNKIKDLIQENSINNSTRLVLVNALYFKSAWQNKFIKEKNTTDKFQIGRKEYIKTTFMNQSISSWYYEDKYNQIIDIPYANKSISLMIILPKSYNKFKKTEKTLSNDFYNNYVKYKEQKRIKLSIPKFKLESEFDLNKTLSDLGIKEAFTRVADFSGITEQEKLFISQVVHKAFIAIYEEGTEATASTAVMIGKTAFINDEVEININRPFIYIIRNNENNCIYFMGKIKNPN